jgi:type I restriction enzyme S subunit
VSGWPQITLSDVATFSSGGTPSKSRPEFWQGDIPWVSPKDMKTNRIQDTEDRISAEAIRSSATRIVGLNSVLVVVRSGILAHSLPVATVGRHVAFNQDIKAITPKNGLLLPEFIFWMLKAHQPEILKIGVKKGATVHSLSNGFLEGLRFALPPLDEQRRIVVLLDRVAEIRRRAEATRAKARAIIPALFLDTFGDPATNPKGWPVSPLGDVADVQGGLQVSAARNALPVELPYLRVANVMRGSLDLSEIKLIRMSENERERTLLRGGDVLIVEGHGNPKEIGRAAVWDGSIDPCTHQNHLIRVRVDTHRLTAYYLETFLNSESGRSILIKKGKTTSGLNTISTQNVKTIQLPLPLLKTQTAYVEKVKRVEAVARNLEAAAAKAEAMAAALSSEVFE